MDIPSGMYDIYACWDMTTDGSLLGPTIDANGNYALTAAIHARSACSQSSRYVLSRRPMKISHSRSLAVQDMIVP